MGPLLLVGELREFVHRGHPDLRIVTRRKCSEPGAQLLVLGDRRLGGIHRGCGQFHPCGRIHDRLCSGAREFGRAFDDLKKPAPKSGS